MMIQRGKNKKVLKFVLPWPLNHEHFQEIFQEVWKPSSPHEIFQVVWKNSRRLATLSGTEDVERFLQTVFTHAFFVGCSQEDVHAFYQKNLRLYSCLLQFFDKQEVTLKLCLLYFCYE